MRMLSLAPLAGPGLDLLRSLGELTIDPWNAHVPVHLHTPQQMIERLVNIDALIVEADPVSAEVFERTNLRFLAVCRGDPNNIDIEAATENGVVVIRTPGRNAEAVADLTLGFMFGLLRSIVSADDDIRAGRWVIEGRISQQRFVGRELASCTVGLVGFGAVGRATAQRLRALKASVIAYDPVVPEEEMRAQGVEPVATLTDLIGRSDIVSVHAPLTDATRALIGEDELKHLKPGSYLVNTARYGIVAEQPLLDALADGRLAGAAFDHFENEFIRHSHPLITMQNVILTPHIGGTTIETIENHTMQIALGLTELLEGKTPPGVVNPTLLSR